MLSTKVQLVSRNWWEKKSNVVEHTIEAETVGALCAVYFKEFDNRYKYCNGVNCYIVDNGIREAYREWIKVTENYANNGGDMW